MRVSVGRRGVIRTARASRVARRVRSARWIRGTTAREEPRARRRGAMRSARGAPATTGARGVAVDAPGRLRACWRAQPRLRVGAAGGSGSGVRASSGGDGGRGGGILTDCRSNRTMTHG